MMPAGPVLQLLQPTPPLARVTFLFTFLIGSGNFPTMGVAETPTPVVIKQAVTTRPTQTQYGNVPQQDYTQLAMAVSKLVTDLIPKRFAKEENWGHTKRITTGIDAKGNLLRLKLHRRKRAVRHGTWKRYQVTLPEETARLELQISNLRSLRPGKIAFRLEANCPLELYGKLRSFNRGIHLFTISAQGVAHVDLQIDCECTISLSQSITNPGVAVRPHVTAAQLAIQHLQVDKLGQIEGKPAEELGRGLRILIEESLDGDFLRDRLNRAFTKQQDRLVLNPSHLFPLP